MGSSSYSSDVYAARMARHATDGTSAFTHDTATRSHAAATGSRLKVHEKLDPKTPNKVGKIIRESFDSDLHPASLPIAVGFDVTGSMRDVPKIFIEKLGKLMSGLVKKGFVVHPQVLFAAIGDATCDDVPLQVGQFEAGNEMDEALSLMVLEGGGGGQTTESYELLMYFLAEKTDLHSVAKRGKKGYCFLLGDELPYSHVKKSEVSQVIGDTLQADLPTEEVLAKLREKFEVFWVMPEHTAHADDDHVIVPLKKMFGQNFIKLKTPADVCELLITTVALAEGYDLDTIKKNLTDVGMDAHSIHNAVTALVPLMQSGALVAAGTVDGDLDSGDASGVERL